MQIEHTVEIICSRGCSYVREVIDILQSGNIAAVEEMQNVADSEQVLAELCAIMAVYDESGGSCCPVPGFADIKKAST